MARQLEGEYGLFGTRRQVNYITDMSFECSNAIGIDPPYGGSVAWALRLWFFYLKLFCPDGVFYCIVTLLKALVLRSILFFLQGCVPSIPLFSFFCVGGGVGVSQSALLMWRHSKRNEGNI